MGWLIALAAVVLIGFVPIGVSARYDEKGPLVKLIAGPIRITVVPGKKKGEKPAKDKKEAAPKSASSVQKTKGGNQRDPDHQHFIGGLVGGDDVFFQCVLVL